MDKMNDSEVERIIQYQNTIIKNNRIIMANLNMLLTSHKKLKKALGAQIGLSKVIIKVLSQFTFDFDDNKLFE